MAEWYQEKQKRADVGKVMELYHAGYSSEEVAKKCELAKTTVIKIVRKNGYRFERWPVDMDLKWQLEWASITGKILNCGM